MLSRSPQLLGLTGVIVGVAAMSCLAVGYMGKSRLVSERESSLMRAESANVALQDELAKLGDELDVTNRTLAEAQARIAALADDARGRLQQQRAELQRQLAASQTATGSISAHIAEM